MARIALLLLLTFATPLLACINDRDSAKAHPTGIDEVAATVVGRFPRNPPLYYEMRLKRMRQALAADPDDLAAYDDAAAALDRLGRSGEALAMIERKRERLEQLDPDRAKLLPHWYSYHANAGTFWAHRWAREGAADERLDEMATAAEHIRKALALDPERHGAREVVQLAFMEWRLRRGELEAAIAAAPEAQRSAIAHASHNPWGLAPEHPGRSGALAELGHDQVIEGLLGLIRLGASWESYDAFVALASALATEGRWDLAYLAAKRAERLREAGRKSLGPAVTDAPPELRFLPMGGAYYVTRRWALLSDEAEAWHERRTDYMLERLRAGRHPDTDPGFWAEWRDTAPPPPALVDAHKTSGPLLDRFADRFDPPRAIARLYWGLGLTLFVPLGALLWRRRRRARVHFP